MKIALAQQNYTIGDITGNKMRILGAIEQAKVQGADLVLFPELSICGYPPQDLLTYPGFIHQCREAITDVAKKCTGIAAIVGGPSFSKHPAGKKLFNTAFFMCDGVIKQEVHKCLLPTYDIFDEYRYFEPAIDVNVINFNEHRIALTICEDLWAEADEMLYAKNPMQQLILQKPDLMINIAASPFFYNQALERQKVLARNALKYRLPLIYVNHVGAQTDLIFDGGSLAMDISGKIIQQLPYFQESLTIIDTESTEKNTAVLRESLEVEQDVKKGYEALPSVMGGVYEALILGIRDYFNKMGFKKAILGLSGGIDSAVVAVLAQRALGGENITAVLLPSRFSSEHSVSDALQLAANLGLEHYTMPIGEAYSTLTNILSPLFGDLPFNLAEENLQARIRGVLLMAIANKFGPILLNTTNKSEMAVGYGTLYGDMCGGLSVLGDVYKTQVYELAQYINKEGIIIPENTIHKAPSAELRPDQKDSDSLPEYGVLDEILFKYIEETCTAEEIIAQGYEKALVERIVTLVNNNEYKRFQAAPVLRISPKAFGRGRVMPLVAKF